MDPGDHTPLSVNEHFFKKVCPNSTVIRVEDVNTYNMRFNETAPVTETFNTWVETIKAIDDPCLMLNPNSHHVFDNWYAQVISFGCKYIYSTFQVIRSEEAHASPLANHLQFPDPHSLGLVTSHPQRILSQSPLIRTISILAFNITHRHTESAGA